MKTQIKIQRQQGGTGGDVAKMIQKRAYERYVERGREPGHELEDWLQAERDVRTQEDSELGE